MTPHEFSELMAGLDQLRDRRFEGGAALATLVRTRGPTFRRPGARMLVHGDGRILRGLSGGCPEADIAERARAVIAEGHAKLLRYDRENGYDALLELGCGGELEVLLEPLATPADLAFADAAARCLRARRNGRQITLFAEGGRCLPRPRRLLWDGELQLDELGDGTTREAVLASALSGEIDGGARFDEIGTGRASQQILVEALQPALRLLLIGVNATTQALARLGRGMGWEVCLVSHRDDQPAAALPDVELLCSSADALTRRLAIDPRCAAVVMTHNLERDLDYLRALQGQPLAYLGAVGSRSRAARMHEQVRNPRTPLHAPAGLDIGSETPEEIALAIAAEIQGHLHGRSGGRLSASDGPIH